eukprot:GHVS01043562.1.p2 GENE.GHVS01043562.1~~GHVS01043562.1.p2  ORF type:complete len:228 (+),score=32.68 GHVS01043562.1:475-1158(+)
MCSSSGMSSSGMSSSGFLGEDEESQSESLGLRFFGSSAWGRGEERRGGGIPEFFGLAPKMKVSDFFVFLAYLYRSTMVLPTRRKGRCRKSTEEDKPRRAVLNMARRQARKTLGISQDFTQFASRHADGKWRYDMVKHIIEEGISWYIQGDEWREYIDLFDKEEEAKYMFKKTMEECQRKQIPQTGWWGPRNMQRASFLSCLYIAQYLSLKLVFMTNYRELAKKTYRT